MSEPHPCQQLTQMITSYRVSRAVYIAAKLRIADHLKGGPRTAEELAATAGVAPRPLYRCEPGSLRAFAIMQGEEQYRCWDDLLETVRTGEPAFERLYGRPIFAYLSERPEQAKLFDAAMTGVSAHLTRAVLDAYDLSDVRTLADVGGGLGANLTLILGRYPAMRGVLFDEPHVVERARPLLEAAGIAGRCTVEGGDFFETAPSGADAYLLGNILHDWDDAKAGRILDTLRRAMPAGSRLLVVETVPRDGYSPSFGKLLDLHMMVVAGGLERTEAEHRQLFAAHGFRLTRVVPTASDISVVEGRPV